MYWLDTNVISEIRKKDNTNPGVRHFFQRVAEQDTPLYISAITIGELRRGVELIRYRGDRTQADVLETWLQTILDNYDNHILDFTALEAQVWGYLRVPHPENLLDKQIAAIALTTGLTVVTRNVRHFEGTGVQVLNPWE